MPNVNGKKYPYTPAGMQAASQARPMARQARPMAVSGTYARQGSPLGLPPARPMAGGQGQRMARPMAMKRAMRRGQA
tara:strand:+ start:655 stop:885 length:231 start_codon:yes stop_codon:yes gene_type:complete